MRYKSPRDDCRANEIFCEFSRIRMCQAALREEQRERESEDAINSRRSGFRTRDCAHQRSLFVLLSLALVLCLFCAPTHTTRRAAATLSQRRGWLSSPRSRASQSRREPASLRGDLSSTSAKVSLPRRVHSIPGVLRRVLARTDGSHLAAAN